MTREEFSNVVKGLKAIYTSDKFIPSKESFDVWYALLSEYDYIEVSNAANVYLRTETFPPVPANIINKIHEIRNMAAEDSVMEIWASVRKAISNGSYHSEEEYEKLPEIAKRSIGSARALRQMAINPEYNEGVEKALFIKQYNLLIAKEKDFNKLPDSIKKAIQENEVKRING